MKYNSELYKSIDGNNSIVDALIESEQPDISADDLRQAGFPRISMWFQNMLAQYAFLGEEYAFFAGKL